MNNSAKTGRTSHAHTARAESAASGPRSSDEQAWLEVVRQFRDQLQQICKSELVCSDQEAQRIIVGMVQCRNMTEVDACMDRLMIRIGELLAAKTGDPSELTRLVTQARERGRAALARHSKRHTFSADDEAGRSTRTVVKL
jgi:hypothetical protein